MSIIEAIRAAEADDGMIYSEEFTEVADQVIQTLEAHRDEQVDVMGLPTLTPDFKNRPQT